MRARRSGYWGCCKPSRSVTAIQPAVRPGRGDRSGGRRLALARPSRGRRVVLRPRGRVDSLDRGHATLAECRLVRISPEGRAAHLFTPKQAEQGRWSGSPRCSSKDSSEKSVSRPPSASCRPPHEGHPGRGAADPDRPAKRVRDPRASRSSARPLSRPDLEENSIAHGRGRLRSRGVRLRPARDRLRTRRPEGGHPGGQARSPRGTGRTRPHDRRRLHQHRHDPVQDAARGGHVPHRHEPAWHLRPGLPRQAGHHQPRPVLAHRARDQGRGGRGAKPAGTKPHHDDRRQRPLRRPAQRRRHGASGEERTVSRLQDRDRGRHAPGPALERRVRRPDDPRLRRHPQPRPIPRRWSSWAPA